MSQTALLINVVPVAGVSEQITPGLKTAWVRAPENGTCPVSFAEAMAEHFISNAELLASVQRFPPAQSWYHEDHEGLY